MKVASLASVLTIVLGVTSAFAASPSTATAKDGITVEHSAAMKGDASLAADQKGTQTDSDYYRNGPVTPTTERSVRNDDSKVSEDIKDGLDKAGNSMRAAADDIKAFFVGDDGAGKMEPIVLHKDRSAHGLIDQPVLNPQGKEICKLKDVVLDKNGKAILAVVSDGGFLGIGDKVAAFDYSKVIGQDKDGKVTMALSQSMIDEAANFSYDRKDAAKAKVIPADSYSVNDILDGKLMNAQGEKVGSVENLALEDGIAAKVIVGFNKKLGLGGDLAALNFSSLKKINAKGEVNLQMNEAQSTQFDRLTKTSMR